MLLKQSRPIRILALALLAVMLMAADCDAGTVFVETESRFMNSGVSCEPTGKVKLTMSQELIDYFTALEPTGRYISINVTLLAEGLPPNAQSPILCKAVSGVETSGLIASVSGEEGDRTIQILITSISPGFADPWLDLGAVNVDVSGFGPGSLLKISLSGTIFGEPDGTAPADFVDDGATPFQIGHFQIEGAIPEAERNALIALYEATNGPGWTNALNWLGEPGTECDWYGVTCDTEIGHVVGIGLDGNNLVGSLPPELASLSRLEFLYLVDNKLSGNIPPELGGLSQLRELQLYANQLSGPIPAQLGNLSQLETLMLSSNSLSGAIPPALGNLSALVWLKLYSNALSGAIPAELGNLSNLEELLLNENQLTGPIPTSLGSLTRLVHLNLTDNQLSGPVPPELGNLTNLDALYLPYNQLTGQIPSELGNLTSLRELVLHNNHLEGTIPAAIGGLGNLEKLFLDSNLLIGPIPAAMLQLTNLINGESEFRWNALYTDNPELRDFLAAKQSDGDWESTQTVAPTDPAVTTVSDTELRVTWTPIAFTEGESGSGYEIYVSETSEGPFSFLERTSDKNADRGVIINLEPNTVYYFKLRTKSIIYYNTVFSEFTDVFSGKTTGETPLPPVFAPEEYQALVDLHQSTNGDAWTAKDNWLQEDVSPCRWYGVQCDENEEHVVALSLNGNNLSGTLPASVVALSKLNLLYLQNNRLSGPLPDSLGQATSLELLNVADNALDGPVPQSFLDLQNLKDNESDFRNNRLFTDPTETELKAFLDQKQIGGEWQSFQNIGERRAIASGETAVDFAMVSFVIKADDPSASAVFGDDIGAYNTEIHRIGTYDPLLGSGAYREFDNGLEIVPGKAYWFFVRDGATLTIQGNPVSLNQDQLVPLAFNAESGDGWNMVACPNQAYYKWDDLMVVELDDSGAPMASTAVSMSSSEAGERIYKQRMWRWRQGDEDYSYYAPPGAPEDSLHSFDSDPYLAAGEGCWVRALKPNSAIWFKKEKQLVSKPEDTFLAATRRAEAWLSRTFDGPRSAVAAAEESPPAPMAGFSNSASSRTDDSGGGGCFIRSVSRD